VLPGSAQGPATRGPGHPWARPPVGPATRGPEEVAAAVVYLASPDAEWASGTILDLNGASYLRR